MGRGRGRGREREILILFVYFLIDLGSDVHLLVWIQMLLQRIFPDTSSCICGPTTIEQKCNRNSLQSIEACNGE